MFEGRWPRLARTSLRVHRSRIGGRWAVAAVLLLVGSLALVWLPDAFSDAGDYTGKSPSPLTLPSAPNEMAWLSDVLGGGLGRRRSQSSQARSQRAASRLAYQRQSSAGALAVVRRKIPMLLKEQAWRGPQLRTGERLQRYVNDSQAVVLEPNHREGLLTGGVPLLGKTPQGNKLPDDLSLTSDGSYLAPASAPARVLVPRSASGALRFPDQGLGMRVASASDQRAQVIDNQAFYPNVLTDTDELARPVPDGAETSFVLRSTKSPRDIPIDVTLPSGDALAQRGGLMQITRAAKPVAGLGPAMATDAQHVTLPTSYSLRGHRVTLHVGGGSDVAYPILVDPTTDIYDLYGQGNNPDYYDTGAPWQPAPASPTLNTSEVSKALYAKGSTNTGTYYTSGQAAQFNRFARNTDTYIYRVDESNISHSDFPNGAISEWFGGIYDETTQYWQPGIFYSAAAGGSWYGPYSTNGYAVGVNTGNFAGVSVQFCALSTCNPGAIDAGNDAVFGLLMTASGYETNQPSTAMGDAGIFSDDNLSPTLSVTSHSNPPPSGWVQDYSDQVTLHSDDKGLGMGAQTVTRSGISKIAYASCNGQYSSCPLSMDGTIAYGTAYGSQQPEGINTYTASASDIVGNTDGGQNRSWTVQIDRTSPVGSVSGPSSASGTVTITGNGADPLGPGANASSGVATVTLTAQLQGTNTWWPICGPIAPDASGNFSCSWDTNTGLLADGTYTIRAQLADNAGNVGTPTTTMTVNNGTPAEDSGTQSMATDSYAADNGLSQSDAQRDVALADKAMPVLDAVDAAVGSSSGGDWFDAAAGQVIINVASATDPPSGSNIDNAQAILDQAGLSGSSTFQKVAASEGSLEGGQAQIDGQLQGLEQSFQVNTEIDTSTDSVVIRTANNLTAAQSDSVQQAAAASGVPTQTEQQASSDVGLDFLAGTSCGNASSAFGSNMLGCEPPIRGGAEIETREGYCTLGFNGYNNAGYIVLTAGHCLSYNEQPSPPASAGATYGDWESYDSGGTLRHIGPQGVWHWGGNADDGWIQNQEPNYWFPNNYPQPPPFVYVGASPSTTTNQLYTIHGIGSSRLKMPVCMTSGPPLQGSAGHSVCGTVNSLHATICGSAPGGAGSVCAHNLVQTTITSPTLGSSGGPYYKARVAYGTLVGRNRSSHETSYVGIRTVQSDLGVTVATG